MKRLMPLLLAAFPAFASITDSTYAVTPPAAGAQCPAIQADLPPGYNCYYLALGEYVDTYLFTVPDVATYAFEVTGSHWHRCVSSGRGHACYTESNTILEVLVVDASGNTVLSLAGVEDDWTGGVDLSAGDYTLVISGVVGGNRPGVYGYSISYDPTPVIPNDPTPIIVDRPAR